MNLSIRHRCDDFNGYRAARVKSLFNAESGCEFNLDAEIDIDDWESGLGVIVGPSGSGKTSLGGVVLGEDAMYRPDDGWPIDAPIVDGIAPGGDFNAVTGALAAVGLGDVPSWLRPYHVLSNGEKFRAGLARLIADPPERVVVDEFSSVVDRQIARFGALAFSKAWKRTGGKCVLLSCHYDILEWLEPDWVYDTATQEFSRRRLRRPRFQLDLWETDWRYWDEFEPHHYLKLPRMIAARCYLGTVEGERVCHVAVGTANKGGRAEARACRLVVMPEWQGAGVGTRFLNAVCQLQLEGKGRLAGRRVTTAFHTSHPGLVAALRRMPQWRQISARLYGTSKSRSRQTMVISERSRTGAEGIAAGFGGHFRAVQGFRYYGDRGKKA